MPASQYINRNYFFFSPTSYIVLDWLENLEHPELDECHPVFAILTIIILLCCIIDAC